MRLDQIKFYKKDFYYPDNKGLHLFVDHHNLSEFYVDMDGAGRDAVHRKFAQLVIEALARMSGKQQEEESEKFFVYLLQNPRRDMADYLEPLLQYFHKIGLLKFKKHVYNDNKQKVVRYKVVFKNTAGKFITEKYYSSLSQLSDDIGKKMTSLHYQLFKIKSWRGVGTCPGVVVVVVVGMLQCYKISVTKKSFGKKNEKHRPP